MNKFGKINWLIVGSFAIVFLSFVIVGVAVKLQTTSFVPTKNYAVSTQCTDTVTLIFPTLTPTLTVTPTVTLTPTPTSIASCPAGCTSIGYYSGVCSNVGVLNTVNVPNLNTYCSSLGVGYKCYCFTQPKPAQQITQAPNSSCGKVCANTTNPATCTGGLVCQKASWTCTVGRTCNETFVCLNSFCPNNQNCICN